MKSVLTIEDDPTPAAARRAPLPPPRSGFGGTFARWLVPASTTLPLVVAIAIGRALSVSDPRGQLALVVMGIATTVMWSGAAFLVARSERKNGGMRLRDSAVDGEPAVWTNPSRAHGESPPQLRRRVLQAGATETFTAVVRNVENVLGTLRGGSADLRGQLASLRIERLAQVAQLIRDHQDDLHAFMTEDARGRHLPDLLLGLSSEMTATAGRMSSDLGSIDATLTRLRDIVSIQDALAAVEHAAEPTELRDLAEAALLLQAADFADIDLVRDYGELPLVCTDRHKLLLIMVCFAANARDAILQHSRSRAQITVRLYRDRDEAVFSIADNGAGMSRDTLQGLWRDGFTTKRDGLGIALHASALAAAAIGATVSAASDGEGRGATFSLRLPLTGGRA
jgi:signal transduction histidine kinase